MKIVAWGCLLAVSVSGCAAVPLPSFVPSRPLAPLPSDLVVYYNYERQPLVASMDSVKPGSGFEVRQLTLSIPGESGFRPIRIDWYKPQGGGEASSSRSHKPDRPGRLPVVLMSPILAGDDLYVREFARFYAARGLHAVLVYRPKEVFSADRDLKDIETHFRESVTQLRQVIDWLQTQESVDPDRIGSFAISMGAILTTILSAVEPRLRCSVLGLPAGHIPEIIMSSQDKAIRKRRRATMEKHGWTQEEALRQLKSVMRSEPMLLASAIDPKRTLVIIGLFDRVLGLGRSLDLWRAMGRPRMVLLPTGHYTAYFATPYLKIVTYSFLRRNLEPGPSPPVAALGGVASRARREEEV